MRNLYPYLKALLVTCLILGIGLSLIGDCISGLLFEGDSCSIKRGVLVSLSTYGPIFLVFILLLLALFLVARHDYLQHAALRQFSFVKSIQDLRPEDFGYQEPVCDRETDLRYRPFYEAYIRRNATPARNFSIVTTFYDEAALTEILRSGDSFVLLGPPLSGKSRTVYEVLKRLKDYVAIAPKRSVGLLPDGDAFVRATKGKKVVLILEDLSDYFSSGFPLNEFVACLNRHAESWSLAATCRDGPEMAVIEAAQGTDMGRFYEGIRLKLRLEMLTAEEKKSLAREIGKEWSSSQSDMYPTPGSIVMEDSMRAMRSRFDHALSLEQKDVLRALQLLAFANVRPFTHDRIKLVLEHPDLFARTGVYLRDCLEALAEQAFLHRPAIQDPVDLEPAYLLEAVDYTEGKIPLDDFPTLVEILDTSADADGLRYIAYSGLRK